VFAVRNVLVVLRIDVLFGETKVDDIDRVVFVARMSSNQEVLGFDISVNKKL